MSAAGDLAVRVAELEARLAVDWAEHERAREVLARVVAVNLEVIAALVEFTEAFEIPAEPDRLPLAACRPARWFLRLRGGGA